MATPAGRREDSAAGGGALKVPRRRDGGGARNAMMDDRSARLWGEREQDGSAAARWQRGDAGNDGQQAAGDQGAEWKWMTAHHNRKAARAFPGKTQ